ncbi:hypothetical protein EYF80_059419 [Liparis tanakae]|uniref:Secreted protein n=1 Tax=Liparis tanakae TaxID=230148 RepID=A0A4Z2EQ39_9TELE|nr:hypothetical protein EYF80_059419 [Liparis tanakae]
MRRIFLLRLLHVLQLTHSPGTGPHGVSNTGLRSSSMQNPVPGNRVLVHHLSAERAAGLRTTALGSSRTRHSWPSSSTRTREQASGPGPVCSGSGTGGPVGTGTAS